MTSPANPAPSPEHLSPNAFIDSDHPAVVAYARTHGESRSPAEAMVALYYAIRDGWAYNPWRVGFERHDFQASGVLLRPRQEGAHCIDKALVLAASARVLGVASRLHFADVRNHIGTARLEKQLGTDRLVFHGWCELWLNGRWVAATPAFNRELCLKLGVSPLEFDGVHDALFQQFDSRGGRFMEYLEDHGSHADVPYEAMIQAWERHYPSVRQRLWPRPEAAQSR